MGRTLHISSIGAGRLRVAFAMAALACWVGANSTGLAAIEIGTKPRSPSSSGPRAPSDSCGAGLAARFIGASARPDVREAVKGSVAHEQIRWIMPGTAVTQDHRPDRLNVILSADGRIMTMRCG